MDLPIALNGGSVPIPICEVHWFKKSAAKGDLVPDLESHFQETPWSTASWCFFSISDGKLE